MDSTADWDSVMQYVSEPDLDLDKSMFAQIPTPPASHSGSPQEEKGDDPVVSISTTFYPTATILSPLPPDLIVLSSDAVFFYVHCHQLLTASQNGFLSLLPPLSSTSPSAKPAKGEDLADVGPIIALAESSPVLNVLLHALYDISCAHYSPSLEVVSDALRAMLRYGIAVKKYVAPSAPLYSLILSQAPVAPLEAYALAAEHDLSELAVPISSHLLSFDLSNITDDVALRMGPVYLRRLFFLHLGRIDALKRLLLPPPHPHPENDGCDFADQKSLTRAWALAAAYLAWDARPDVSTSTMESALAPLGNHLSCEVCQKSLADRIKQLIIQWSVVKRTI